MSGPQPAHYSWCDDDNHGYERPCRRAASPEPTPGLREALERLERRLQACEEAPYG